MEKLMDINPWLMPFKGRNNSLSYDQNFVWNDNSIYIMDNHRSALWCWLQHISSDNNISIFHIDRHYDSCPCAEMEQMISDLAISNINDFLKILREPDNEQIPLIRWDNYLLPFLNQFQDRIEYAIFSTHSIGDPPDFDIDLTFIR